MVFQHVFTAGQAAKKRSGRRQYHEPTFTAGQAAKKRISKYQVGRGRRCAVAFQVERYLDQVPPSLCLSVHTLCGSSDQVRALLVFVEDQEEVVWRLTVCGAEIIDPFDRFEKHSRVEHIGTVLGERRRLFDADIKAKAAQAFDFIEEPIREVPEFSIPQDITICSASFPCLGVAGVASRRFWCDGETDPERSKHLHHRADAWVALAGQRFVQAGPTQVGFLGDGGHAYGARHVANRLDEKFRVVFFERGLQVCDPGLGISQKLGTIPRGIRFFGHVASLESARHVLSALDVLLLARFIAAAQQEH